MPRFPLRSEGFQPHTGLPSPEYQHQEGVPPPDGCENQQGLSPGEREGAAGVPSVLLKSLCMNCLADGLTHPQLQ